MEQMNFVRKRHQQLASSESQEIDNELMIMAASNPSETELDMSLKQGSSVKMQAYLGARPSSKKGRAGSSKKGFYVHKKGDSDFKRSIEAKPMRHSVGPSQKSTGYTMDEEPTRPTDYTRQADQDFSYYGRRFIAAAEVSQMSPQPAAEDITNQPAPKIGRGAPQLANKSQIARQRLAVSQNMGYPNESHTEQQHRYAKHMVNQSMNGQGPQYYVEERMNDNLMRQFKGMCETDTKIQPNSSMINSISEFSNNSSQGRLSTANRSGRVNQSVSGIQIKKPLKSPGTSIGGKRAKMNSVDRSMKSTMSRSGINFNTTQNTSKKLPNKLPPRAQMSPGAPLVPKSLTKTMSKKSVLNSTQRKAKPSPIKNGMFFAGQAKTTSVQQTKKEVLVKRGGRSISRTKPIQSFQETSTERSLRQQVHDFRDQAKRSPSRSRSGPRNLEERQANYSGRCSSCSKSEHSGLSKTSSKKPNLNKFHKDYDKNGKRIRKRQTQHSRESSQDSGISKGSIVTSKILEKRKPVARSEIGFKMQSLPASQTRQLQEQLKPQTPKIGLTKRPTSRKKIRSQTRGSDSGGNSGLLTHKNVSATINNHRQPRCIPKPKNSKNKSKVVAALKDKFESFSRSGNRPSVSALPKQKNFSISKINVAGSDPKRMSAQQDDTRSRGSSWTRDPRLLRMNSTRSSAWNRLQSGQDIPQKDTKQLLDSEIKKMAEEWEGDPNQDAFWQKFNGPEAEKGRKETLRGMNVLNKQGGVLNRQESVYRQLTERDDASVGHSIMGTLRDNSGTRPPNLGLDSDTRSQQQYMDHLQKDEPIDTEMDQSILARPDSRASRQRYRPRVSQTRNEKSRDVLTDYSIQDDVGTMQQTLKQHEIPLRAKDFKDGVPIDSDIHDEFSKSFRPLGASTQNQSKTMAAVQDDADSEPSKPTMNLGSRDPEQEVPLSGLNNKSPPVIKNAEKDSEDADSAESEMVESAKPSNFSVQDSNQSKSMREESYDDEDERLSKEEKKTFGRVTMYDDFLEEKARKEIDQEIEQEKADLPQSPGTARSKQASAGNQILDQEPAQALRSFDQRPKTQGPPIPEQANLQKKVSRKQMIAQRIGQQTQDRSRQTSKLSQIDHSGVPKPESNAFNKSIPACSQPTYDDVSLNTSKNQFISKEPENDDELRPMSAVSSAKMQPQSQKQSSQRGVPASDIKSKPNESRQDNLNQFGRGSSIVVNLDGKNLNPAVADFLDYEDSDQDEQTPIMVTRKGKSEMKAPEQNEIHEAIAQPSNFMMQNSQQSVSFAQHSSRQQLPEISRQSSKSIASEALSESSIKPMSALSQASSPQKVRKEALDIVQQEQEQCNFKNSKRQDTNPYQPGHKESIPSTVLAPQLSGFIRESDSIPNFNQTIRDSNQNQAQVTRPATSGMNVTQKPPPSKIARPQSSGKSPLPAHTATVHTKQQVPMRPSTAKSIERSMEQQAKLQQQIKESQARQAQMELELQIKQQRLVEESLKQKNSGAEHTFKRTYVGATDKIEVQTSQRAMHEKLQKKIQAQKQQLPPKSPPKSPPKHLRIKSELPPQSPSLTIKPVPTKPPKVEQPVIDETPLLEVSLILPQEHHRYSFVQEAPTCQDLFSPLPDEPVPLPPAEEPSESETQVEMDLSSHLMIKPEPKKIPKVRPGTAKSRASHLTEPPKNSVANKAQPDEEEKQEPRLKPSFDLFYVESPKIEILSQIECEYNADQLSRKVSGDESDAPVTSTNDEMEIQKLYMLGTNTLHWLMYELKLHQEWDTQTQVQVKSDWPEHAKDVSVRINATVILLQKCSMMYDAKTLVQRILKLANKRDELVKAFKLAIQNDHDVTDALYESALSKNNLTQIQRLTLRITSQIKTLHEEHLIFKPPFMLSNKDYLQLMSSQNDELKDALDKQ